MYEINYVEGGRNSYKIKSINWKVYTEETFNKAKSRFN